MLKGLPAGPAPGVKPERRPKTMPQAASAKQLLVRTVALGNLSPEMSPQALAYAQSVTEVRSTLPLHNWLYEIQVNLCTPAERAFPCACYEHPRVRKVPMCNGASWRGVHNAVGGMCDHTADNITPAKSCNWPPADI